MKDENQLNYTNQPPLFIYTYACRDEETSLFQLELRTLFGVPQVPPNMLISRTAIDPSRSPFIKERIEVMYEGDTLASILEQVSQIQLGESTTFKVIFVKTNDLDPTDKVAYDDRRAIERDLGMHINGEADVRNPDFEFGIVTMGGRWYFGSYMKTRTVWLQHIKKPRSYSIALSTRVARAAVNIAIPNPHGVKAIDPCCGIGTVLVEALSMGIDIVGRDINPFIAQGARMNIAHFGYDTEVALGAIENVSTTYDAAIVDMPYNLFSTTSPEEQYSILKHARRIAKRVVVITIEDMDERLATAGFAIIDRCVVRKGSVIRQIILCT
ncbi:MAG: methyltransferase [Paenibacillus sp.]|jgi:tRNA G10  N-methylase Trm11|nr:methyltransferase [Paenibacillus sp.]